MDKEVVYKLLKSRISGNSALTINDLREKEYTGVELTPLELKAIRNYEKYRLKELNNHLNDQEFNKVYQFLQVMANLWPWEEFLDEKYCT